MFSGFKDEEFGLLYRFATEDRVVDDGVRYLQVTKDGLMPFPVATKIEIRLTQIFEVRDGEIKENQYRGSAGDCLDTQLKLPIESKMFNEDSVSGRLSEWVGTFKVKVVALRLY